MATTPTFRKPDRYKLSSYRAFNSKMIDRYDGLVWIRVFEAVRWDQTVISELAPGLESLRVLDVGCATGRLLLALGEAGAHHLAGLDLAPRIVERAREKLERHGFEADLKTADAEDHIPWPDGFFDVAVLSGVLHHFFRPSDALREIYRILAPGGRILIIDPWFRTPLRQMVNLYLRFFYHDGDCRFYSPERVVRMLDLEGWTSCRYRRIAWHSYLVRATKRGLVNSRDGGDGGHHWQPQPAARNGCYRRYLRHPGTEGGHPGIG
jgi:demethylmenaquinone methyltransferase/2-methoxy-6-polyprenyl-1,4-benzoquinol methylase